MDPFEPLPNVVKKVLSTVTDGGDLRSEFLTTLACGEEGGINVCDGPT